MNQAIVRHVHGAPNCHVCLHYSGQRLRHAQQVSRASVYESIPLAVTVILVVLELHAADNWV